MQKTTTVQQLTQYITQEVLGGKGEGLDEKTPLLELGIINSFEMARLLAFIQKKFGVDIPSEKLVASYFTNIATIADLIEEQRSLHPLDSERIEQEIP